MRPTKKIVTVLRQRQQYSKDRNDENAQKKTGNSLRSAIHQK